MSHSTDATAAPRRTPLRLALGLVALAALLLLGHLAGGYVPRFAEWVQGQGWQGAAVFVVGYATAVVVFVPGSLLTLAAGAIFGVAYGTVLVFLAATAGATAAFLIARHGGRGWVQARLAGDARFAAVDRAVAEQGRKIVLLLRLSPVFPFNLLNYALGLTQVSTRDYVVASIGMLPGTLLYVYSGALAGQVAAVAGGSGAARGPAQWALLAVGLVATAAVTLIITRIARRALHDAGADG